MARSRKSSVLTPATRAGAALLGVGIFAAGVAAVFETENGTGAAALLAIGAGFFVFAVLGDRVQSMEFGGVSLTIRDLARQTFTLAKAAERRGENETAERLRAVGRALQDLATEYRRLRGSMRAGSERTRALEHVMTESRRLAQIEAFEATDVATWFDEGTPEARITALGLMQGNPDLRDFEAALDAIEDPHSAFEQYHGLRLAEMMVPELTRGQRAELEQILKRSLRGIRVRRDSDRRRSTQRILEALAKQADPS